MLAKFSSPTSELFYHRKEYLDLISKETGYRFGEFELGGIRTNLFQIESTFGTHLCTSPYFGFNGIFSFRDALQHEKSSFEAELLYFIRCMYRDPNIQSLSIYLPFSPEGDISTLSTNALGSLLENNDIYCIDKATDYISLDAYRLPPKRRYDLRRADNAGISTYPLAPTVLPALYDIYLRECINRDIPVKSRSFINNLLCIQDSKSSEVYGTVAFKEGNLVGGLVTVSGPEIASYYLPIVDYRFSRDQVGVKLISEHLEYWSTRKKKYFNFESSPSNNSNVRKFKQGFGTVSCKYQIVGFAKSDVRKNLAELIIKYGGFFFYPR